jgi:uncharacterized damage-inducible protein DinB
MAEEFIEQDLRGATFRSVDLTGATFRSVGFHHVTMRGVELGHVDITGEVLDLVINGVDVGPLIEAELDRREPDRVLMRARTPEEFRHAWEALDRLWAATVAKARELPEEALHASVDGEWSFVETLRHLVFVADSWISRALLGVEDPYHPWALPWDDMPRTYLTPWDREVRPSLDEVLAVRASRWAEVSAYLDHLTPELLAATVEPTAGDGWPYPHAWAVLEVLGIVLVEEWEHRRYAERDLDVLLKR